MNHQDMWDAFAKTGRIEDYLRYRGVDIYTARIGHSAPTSSAHSATDEENGHAADHRRPDHTGIQQYR